MRKKDSVTEEWGGLVCGNVENRNVGLQGWRWGDMEEGEEGNPLDELEAEGKGRMTHRELRE